MDLYEKLMGDIAKIVKKHINEEYATKLDLSDILADIIYSEDFLEWNGDYDLYDMEDDEEMRRRLIDNGNCINVCSWVNDCYEFENIRYYLLDDGGGSYHVFMGLNGTYYDAYNYNGVTKPNDLMFVNLYMNGKYSDDEILEHMHEISVGTFDYNDCMKLINSIKPVNESFRGIEKHGTHSTFYLNMDLELPKKERIAPKMSKKEFLQLIDETYKKHADENDMEKLKGKPCNAWKFISKFMLRECSNKDIAKKSLMLQLNLDMMKIKHSCENLDTIDDVHMTKTGIPYILGCMHGDWEETMLFMVYWDGKTFRGYIPMRGNTYNRDTNYAIGNDDEADDKFFAKQFKEELGDKFNTWTIRQNVRYNKKACIEDFEARLKVK